MNHWNWWALAGVLAIVEIFAPGFVFIWLAVGAAATGFLALLLPDQVAWQGQLLFFAAVVVASAGGWFVFRRGHPPEVSDEPLLNRRGARHVGETATLIVPIVNGHGRVKLGDSSWSVTGPDLPAGTRVRITGLDGTRLVVAPADTP
ncbi:MAG TPA: NfeD family protein [Geminicoccaceae bacterium]|nr:NfeD family protein [Geminicoccaceae bacterium]